MSLAAVAGDPQLTTTALYRYVESKDALLELMVDHAVGQPAELPDGDWRSRAHEWSRALWSRYLEHPWLTDVQVGGMPRHPNRIAWIEQLLIQLDHGSIAEPMRTALLLDAIARTFAVLARSASTVEPPPAWLTDVIAQRHPRLARELTRNWTDVDDELDRAVDTVLLGSERTSPTP
jgi:AcrR family transcriptional regulator